MKNRGKRIVIGLVVGVLVATVIVCTAVPQVRETIKYYIGKLAKEGNGKTDQERIQEIVYNDEFYTTLGEDEKKAFDNKLNHGLLVFMEKSRALLLFNIKIRQILCENTLKSLVGFRFIC